MRNRKIKHTIQRGINFSIDLPGKATTTTGTQSSPQAPWRGVPPSKRLGSWSPEQGHLPQYRMN
jgi:hypothetical protein